MMPYRRPSRFILRLPLLMLLGSVPLEAVAALADGRIAQIDVLADAPVRSPRILSPNERRLLRPGSEVRYDDTFGVPSFVRTAGSVGAAAAARRVRPRDIEAEARLHLKRVASMYDLDASDIDSLVATQLHDTGRGGVIVKFREDIDGIEVFREEVAVLMDRDLDSVAVSGHVSGAARRGARAATTRFALDAADAIAASVVDRTSDSTFSASDVVAGGPAKGQWTEYRQLPSRRRASGAMLTGPLRSKPVYFRDATGYRAAWYVEVAAEVPSASGGVDGDLVSYVIAADDGEILFRHDMTARDTFSYRVQARTTGEKIPYGDPYGGGAIPNSTGGLGVPEPAFAAPNLVTLQNGPISANDPWLPAGATTTVGNNVEAYADLTAPDGYNVGDVHAPVTSPGVFDSTYDFFAEPSATATQSDAAVAQMFYTANYLHDAFYDVGFDEAAGNAQEDNYGRGGLGGDRMKVEAQDYSGFDNADMSTPSDGGEPRMQMYQWEGRAAASLTVNSPSMTAAVVAVASFGSQTFSVTADIVLVDDGAATSTDGCEPIVNSVAGKIALVDRGDCYFTVKVENAMAAGAVGVLIANNVDDGTVIGMSGTCSGPCELGVLMVSHRRGAELVAALALGTVNVTMQRQLSVGRDGGFDGDIVAHEWGHYLSGRLVGNGDGLASQQSAGMGEGWSDFNALLMSVEEGDDLAGVYPTGTYASAAFSDDPMYFGIRRVPYSTDMTKDPLTFRHIGDGVAVGAVPCNGGGCSGLNNAEVHNTGEVWATMLWECYSALLADTTGVTPRLTFDEAKQRMKSYFVEHLKLLQYDPTFTEARDALLAAAAANDPVDAELFCRAFARRGIGHGAVAPARYSSTNFGVVESYTCVPSATCDSSPRGDCSVTSSSLLSMQGNALAPARQQLLWKWSKGTASLAQFGDPTAGATNYRMCIYDDSALVADIGLSAGDGCGNRSCWKATSSGYTYKNTGSNLYGVASVKIKSGVGAAAIQVKGVGSSLTLPFPVVDTIGVTVQFVKDASSGGQCWCSDFAAPATKNDAAGLTFSDKLP